LSFVHSKLCIIYSIVHKIDYLRLKIKIFIKIIINLFLLNILNIFIYYHNKISRLTKNQ